MRRLIGGLVIVAGFWLYNGGWAEITGTQGGESGDPTIGFATQDPEMSAAISEARTSLPLFLSKLTDSSGNSLGNVSLKVAFEIAEDSAEIIWVGPFNWDGGTKFTGRLANQPSYMEGLNAGDPVDFTFDMVRDWSLTAADGTLWGNYTTRVMIPQLDEQTATALTGMLSADPVPADWN